MWQPAPDTKEVRQHLLDLLSQMQDQPSNEYPAGVYLDELVVWQLGELREARSIEHLRRIMALRLEEIFQLIAREIDQTSLLDYLRAGVFLCGGGARIPGILLRNPPGAACGYSLAPELRQQPQPRRASP